MTIKELNELADACLEKKIRQLKTDSIEIYFDDSAFIEPGTGLKPGPIDTSNQMPSDEELLNWSSPITMVEEPKN